MARFFPAQAYSVCDPGEDVVGVLTQIAKARGLLGTRLAPRALEHPDPKQALRVGGCGVLAGGLAG